MSKCLPNFLIVGAAKSGTSSLHNFLRKHNDVFMPNYIHNIKAVSYTHLTLPTTVQV